MIYVLGKVVFFYGFFYLFLLFFQEKLDKMKQTLNRMENERRNLQEELGKSETRATKLELQRMSLDGDLQRLQMMLQEREANIQVFYYTRM